ncbi:MAG: hypothetical protein A2359_01500 [Candidatus Moranbacteria bacterium RIFOXYB1_FULL_43_19]|nr:MAG: hypothetical protein A2359_01500 [Candidatus Moranbacteria bacterium RIFOXYB1_FULL_43_19]OGI27539.1 MAG: hypothetical protein A2184_04855 [Candidatus Moranbacteria bacterium RIFOXYA1_FULL_44_7]OGI33522.1 MAG: hypothetical protein A2420_00135 [Candidatus Moranbacteria bacterium RIFOXYC1_FULL_44_13]OGI38396.1 MAG: hypothetical protein A2612_02720 [Candidatus Moranbacteria bacterium RIFOXYD1_FULL_44_12]
MKILFTFGVWIIAAIVLFLSQNPKSRTIRLMLMILGSFFILYGFILALYYALESLAWIT